jgi:hypothetical protein
MEPFNGIIPCASELIGGDAGERGGIAMLRKLRHDELGDRPSNVMSLDDYAGASPSVDSGAHA